MLIITCTTIANGTTQSHSYSKMHAKYMSSHTETYMHTYILTSHIPWAYGGCTQPYFIYSIFTSITDMAHAHMIAENS